MANDVNFNLQSFLSEMRGEMHAGFARLEANAVKVREDLEEHEKHDIIVAAAASKRIDQIADEQDRFHTAFWWTVKTVIAALIVGGIGLVFAAFR